MKKRILYFLPFLFFFGGLSAQLPQAEKPLDHLYYVQLLNHAKDSLYAAIKYSYDVYIAQHPEDYLTQIERCKLIENAYFDANEDYNPKYEEWEVYKDSLLEKFPGVPEVVLYQSESVWGDSTLPFCDRVLADVKEFPEKWRGKQIWKIYEKLANQYNNDENAALCIKYGELAAANNDTLDLTLMLAKQYKATHQNGKAIEQLLSRLDSANDNWSLTQKGKLLLELGAPQKALIAFRLAGRDTAGWQDNGGLAEAMIANGMYEDARVFLLRESEKSWNKAEALNKLFKYDLKYSVADSAEASYRRLVQVGFVQDPIGVKRLRLFFKSPFCAWHSGDALRLFLMLVLLIALLFFPYLWILPIHYLGMHFRRRGMLLAPSAFSWTLRHFWIACSLLLIVDTAANVIFNDEFFSGKSLEGKESNELANLTVFGIAGFVLTTLLLLKRSDWSIIWGTIWSKGKMVMMGIGGAVGLRLALGIYLFVFKMLNMYYGETPGFLSVRYDLYSINEFYSPWLGFLIVVILAPIYEEILFRGIFLSALEKYMKFFLANFLQAVLFMVIHPDLKLYPFYFGIGFLAGYFRNKTQALGAGIVMHAANNLVAFLYML